MQVRVVREIRMLRAMWRELETKPLRPPRQLSTLPGFTLDQCVGHLPGERGLVRFPDYREVLVLQCLSATQCYALCSNA